MKHLRIPMIILAAIHVAFTVFTAMVGAFADGGSIPERILVSLVHPVAAILLLVAVSSSKPLARKLRRATLAVVLIAVAADIVLAVLIGQGAVKGDWSLPLVFAIVPVLGLAYMSTTAGESGE